MHHLTDVYTSLGVFAGLILIKVTGYQIIDPIAAIMVALLIFKAAWDLTVKAFGPLLDASLDSDSVKLIASILDEYQDVFLEYHELRTRKAGRECYIDLHMVLHPQVSIQEAHDLCDAIEARIESAISFSHVLIHVEPADISYETEGQEA
nr:cation diffusion facilitator family transporter [Syntrophomonas palmitatica]